MSDQDDAWPSGGLDYRAALEHFTAPGLYEAAVEARRRKPRWRVHGDPDTTERWRVAQRTRHALERDFYQRWRFGEIIARGRYGDPVEGPLREVSEDLAPLVCKSSLESVFRTRDGAGIFYQVRFYRTAYIEAWRSRRDRDKSAAESPARNVASADDSEPDEDRRRDLYTLIRLEIDDRKLDSSYFDRPGVKATFARELFNGRCARSKSIGSINTILRAVIKDLRADEKKRASKPNS